jgi:hypothetical protein
MVSIDDANGDGLGATAAFFSSLFNGDGGVSAIVRVCLAATTGAGSELVDTLRFGVDFRLLGEGGAEGLWCIHQIGRLGMR